MTKAYTIALSLLLLSPALSATSQRDKKSLGKCLMRLNRA